MTQFNSIIYNETYDIIINDDGAINNNNYFQSELVLISVLTSTFVILCILGILCTVGISYDHII